MIFCIFIISVAVWWFPGCFLVTCIVRLAGSRCSVESLLMQELVGSLVGSLLMQELVGSLVVGLDHCWILTSVSDVSLCLWC